ncbi:NmrA family NAD(P)-binding protein [Nocardia sp. NPDC056100]|uniref:NmrA family NAD(P)-binding protein n=1 Tax=Nocardia sp. NPDC056100 TaxID=3345712 RepID=UPI0035D67B26
MQKAMSHMPRKPVETPSQTILVTGATGLQGGAVARRLLADGHRVRALVRNPLTPAAVALAGLGIELATGDFADAGAVRAAADGADHAYVMGTPAESGPDVERDNAIRVLDAVADAGVGHITYSSAAAADREIGIPWFDSKKDVELHLAGVPVPWTIIAPVVFMDVMLAPHVINALRAGFLPMALPAVRALAYVDVADIAGFAAAVVTQPADFSGQRIEIASDELTGPAAAAAISAATGRAITYVVQPLGELAAWNPELARMFQWFDEVGFGLDLPALHAAHPRVRWHTFAEWAATTSWAMLDTHDEHTG